MVCYPTLYSQEVMYSYANNAGRRSRNPGIVSVYHAEVIQHHEDPSGIINTRRGASYLPLL